MAYPTGVEVAITATFQTMAVVPIMRKVNCPAMSQSANRRIQPFSPMLDFTTKRLNNDGYLSMVIKAKHSKPWRDGRDTVESSIISPHHSMILLYRIKTLLTKSKVEIL